MTEQMRLNKYLAECGLCSRREADRLIEQGRVTLDGDRAETGAKVTLREDGSAVEKVAVNGTPLGGPIKSVVLAFYKPVGVTCTEKDRHAEKIISDIIRYPVRVTYAGRLDRDSEGLLLLTNDGSLIDAMMRGANRHEKEYIVKTDREITPVFVEKMSRGIWLEELGTATRACHVEKTGKYTFRIVLTQGLNRQIRRMCGVLGCRVMNLRRVRVMNIVLGDLKSGCYREVKGKELKELYLMAGLGHLI